MNDFMDWHDSCSVGREIARMIDWNSTCSTDFASGSQAARLWPRGESITPFSVFTRAWLDVVPNQETFENNKD